MFQYTGVNLNRQLVSRVKIQIYVPDIGRVLPVYVADRYEGFGALLPSLDEVALDHLCVPKTSSVSSPPQVSNWRQMSAKSPTHGVRRVNKTSQRASRKCQ